MNCSSPPTVKTICKESAVADIVQGTSAESGAGATTPQEHGGGPESPRQSLGKDQGSDSPPIQVITGHLEKHHKNFLEASTVRV